MSEIKYFTPEGLQKLKDELDDLILRERPRIVQAIQEARDKGDLSENAEYDAAKEAQGLLEGPYPRRVEDGQLEGAALLDGENQKHQVGNDDDLRHRAGEGS